MPLPTRVSQIKDQDVASLFTDEDPEKLFSELQEIGHGSFGAVYFARNVKTSEGVAIKKMSYNGKSSSDKWQDIIKEVKFLRQVKHKNCIQYKGCYLREQTAWLAMEYCIGSASDIVEVLKKPLQEDEIAAVCDDALQGLEYLHNNDRIHRDIKAGNILLEDNGTVKLGDFGSASLVSPANSFVGTPYWMAPEVILAMDEGQYDGKVDIWSLGITCVELAERKPPLFNMNAMSALYHIAQNDPPSLTTTDWSDEFLSFVNVCLAKEATDRPSATELLQHPFLTRDRSNNCIKELIERTKKVAKDQDNMSFRRVRKILIDPHEDSQSNENSDDSVFQNNETNSVESRTSIDTSSNMGSINSLPDGAGGASVSNGTGRDSRQHSSDTSSMSSVAEPQTPVSLHINSENNRENFKTIRPTSLVTRQAKEHESALKEQMTGYKRMRRTHQKQLLQLEEKMSSDMVDLKAKLDKEYELCIQTNAKELERLLQKRQVETEKKNKQDMMEEKKERKLLTQLHDSDLKSFQSKQRKDYKHFRDQKKRELDGRSRREIEEQLRKHKETLLQQQQQEEFALVQKQKEKLERELRKLKGRLLLDRHAKQQDQIREEIRKRRDAIEMEQYMALRHHDNIRVLEESQLEQIQDLRTQQMEKQFSTELANQEEYNEKSKNEQQKRHASETKQHPKNLRAKEQDIKKQLRDTIKTQEKQYKVLAQQILQTTSRDQQKIMLKRMKDEQRRKIAILAEEYGHRAQEMQHTQSRRLTASQQRECEEKEDKLKKEMDQLNAYQARTRQQLQTQHSRERADLQERIDIRRKKLEERIDQDTKQLQQMKETTIHDFLSKQKHELVRFDEETLSQGIRNLSIEEIHTQSYGNTTRPQSMVIVPNSPVDGPVVGRTRRSDSSTSAPSFSDI
ncbi:serine/threonine-protein kinase TAO1-like isoform X2 [Apostichopus japonicus]|uniref:serine/threonine-protein kinase TAO1-like isoform X2 n=1 Tax=Stichopus japonicus TaxID=307972 RepID=UPI003AB558E4